MNADFDFTVVPKLQEGESMIFYVEVGNLSQAQAMKFLESVRDSFKSKVDVGDSNQYFFVPMRDGQKAIEIEVNKEVA